MTFEAIKVISKNKFCLVIKKAIQTRALEYLMSKQGSKGQEIKYTELKMAEYLLPNFQNITIDEQRSIFALRNRIVFIPLNFPNGKKEETMCPCGQVEI